MNTDYYAQLLAQQYGFAPPLSLKAIGNGHINTTMLLGHRDGSVVVQKLNTQVFPEPEKLVANARKIEQHLMQKHQASQYDLEVIKHVPTLEGGYLLSIDGEHWRALEFIGNSRSEEVVQSPLQAQVAASAFGRFAAALQDFDAESLYPVIKDFHNLAMRMDMLEQAVQADKLGRVKDVQQQLDFCREQAFLIDEVAAVSAQIPLRPCHNDTKINNMLFSDKQGTSEPKAAPAAAPAAKAVIDLDTCMPGYWLFDFGDMVRTFCSPEEEDSINLANVRVREEIFAALVKGYIEPLKAHITAEEKASFWLGARVMPFMIGVRFLTDYIDGDHYFSIKHGRHNLDRANNQFALYRSVLAQQERLKSLINNA
ncbi:phosphotransferase enzyme family protein [Pseudoalteromonas sp. T1lg48]|uniref:phosphotransferase enzyme family protein n=1 Tax=Pseudoalteromonas sp. T1lg48 TaxID=2077100 RepID=UPI000CF693DF|nr:aminoglycoside phosphotransferase family protein [Pseudoalteromonas sp. T1lg48]